jgi:hypothetical protein
MLRRGYYMKQGLMALAILCILLSVFPIPRVAAAYHTKTEMITMFKNLCEDYPSMASYEVIGKSCLGNDIYMFVFGNMSGGRVLWDSQLHGNEDAGSEICYWFAQWLLTNNTERTRNILEKSCFMVIPVVNPDSTGRTNANHYGGTVRYGVNLNRNFVNGWGQSGSSDKSSTEYRGPSAGSENETQVMRSVFSQYEPMFYVNTHMWGGPIVYSYRDNDPTTVSALKTEMEQLRSEFGGTPYGFTSIGGGGFAIGDAGVLGIQSFLLEINDENTPSLNTLKSDYYPKCRLLLLAMFDLAYPTAGDHTPMTEDDYDGKWKTTDFIISLMASDSGGDLAEIYYRIGSGSVRTVSANGQPRITTENANNTLEYWSTDNAGNEENHHYLTGIKLDKTRPTMETPSQSPSDSVNQGKEVKVSVEIIDAGSGVKNATLLFTMNNGSSWETPRPMSRNVTTGYYEATIPGQPDRTVVKYKIAAYDDAENERIDDNAGEYYVYSVVPEFPSLLVPQLLTLATLLAILYYRRKHKPDSV